MLTPSYNSGWHTLELYFVLLEILRKESYQLVQIKCPSLFLRIVWQFAYGHSENQMQLSKEILISATMVTDFLSLSFGLRSCLTHRGTYTQRNSLCKDIPPNFLSLVMHCCSLKFKTFEHFFGLLGEFLFFSQMFRQCSKQRLLSLHLTNSWWNTCACTKAIQTQIYTKQVQKYIGIYY